MLNIKGGSNTQENSIEKLRQLQALPLDLKVELSKTRIQEWVNEYGDDGVYVSFSGGKDSTVLLDIVRQNHPDVPAVFCDTGLEYPEIRSFVKSFDNVEIIKPKMNFKEVIRKYGYPLISKGQAQKIQKFRTTGSDKMMEICLHHPTFGISAKHQKLLYAPFKTDDRCCNVMKKLPFTKYNKITGRYPITGQMAAEGLQRQNQWAKYGCNMYDTKQPKSNPLSFWSEQDILRYIKSKDLPIAGTYGNIVIQEDGNLSTTGLHRTGCMFCGFGAHMDKEPNRFQRMKITHPAQYRYCVWGGGGGVQGWLVATKFKWLRNVESA